MAKLYKKAASESKNAKAIAELRDVLEKTEIKTQVNLAKVLILTATTVMAGAEKDQVQKHAAIFIVEKRLFPNRKHKRSKNLLKIARI